MKKTIMYLGVFAVLFASALGMTAFAASDGALVGGMNGGKPYATIHNNEATKRYCYVTLYHSGYSDGSNKSVLATKSGSVSSGGSLKATQSSSKSYFYAKAAKYKGSAQQSGVANSYSISFRK